MANAFKRAWSNSGRLKYEIEEFALPIKNASNLTNAQMYSDFFESDQYSFWDKMLPAIQLTDTGIVYAKLKIQMDIVWLDCMKKNVFMFL